MDLKTFFETMVAGVAADSALQTWANAQYSKDATIYKGVPYNEMDEPTDAAPLVALFNPEKESADDDRTPEYSFGAWLVLSDSGTVTRGDDAIEQAAVDNIMDFAEKVKDAIRAVVPANYAVRINEAFDTIGALPEIHGYLDFSFVEMVLMGANPLD
jgi:hypothetical protein